MIGATVGPAALPPDLTTDRSRARTPGRCACCSCCAWGWCCLRFRPDAESAPLCGALPPRRVPRLGGVRHGALRGTRPGPAERQARRDPARSRRRTPPRSRTAEQELQGIQSQRQRAPGRRSSSWPASSPRPTTASRRPRPTPIAMRWSRSSRRSRSRRPQKKLEEAKTAARRSAVLLYQRSDSSAMLDLIGSADGSGDFVEGSHYLHARVRQAAGRRRTREHRSVDELNEQQAQLERRSQARRRGARPGEPSEQQQIRGSTPSSRRRSPTLPSAEQTYNGKVADLGAQTGTTRSGVRGDVATRSRPQLAAAAATRRRYGNGTFIRPIAGAPITSGFGYRTDPITGQQALHAGIDFGASCGTPIHAAGSRDGVVAPRRTTDTATPPSSTTVVVSPRSTVTSRRSRCRPVRS